MSLKNGSGWWPYVASDIMHMYTYSWSCGAITVSKCRPLMCVLLSMILTFVFIYFGTDFRFSSCTVAPVLPRKDSSYINSFSSLCVTLYGSAESEHFAHWGLFTYTTIFIEITIIAPNLICFVLVRDKRQPNADYHHWKCDRKFYPHSFEICYLHCLIYHVRIVY
jgi:hypothetical protein